MKLLILLALTFGFLPSAKAFELTFDEAKTLDYLLKEAESLRYRKLYAAAMRKIDALETSDPAKKAEHLERARQLEEEAQGALDLTNGIHDLFRQQPEGEAGAACDHQISVYQNAIHMIQKLQDHGFVEQNVAETFVPNYNFSINIFKTMCENQKRK